MPSIMDPRILDRRITRLPGQAPLAPRQPVARTNKTPLSFAAPINPLDRRQITVCDPTVLAPAVKTVTAATVTSPAARIKKTSYVSLAKRIRVATAAGATAVLATTTAYAGGLFSLPMVPTSLREIVGWAALGLGVFLTGRMVRQQLKASNYRSARSELSTGNPTLRKIFKTLIVPAFKKTMAVGSFMALAPLADKAITPWLAQLFGTNAIPVLGMPWTLEWIAFSALLGRQLVRTAVSCAKDIKDYVVYKTTGKQKNDRVPPKFGSLVFRLFTNVWANGAWLGGVSFMAQLSGTFATQVWNMALNLGHNAWVGNAAVLPATGFYGVLFGGVALLYHLAVGRRREHEVGHPNQEHPSLARTAAETTLKGVALGAAVALAGPGLAAGSLLIFAAVIYFAQNYIHSSRSQETALTQKDKLDQIYDRRSTEQGVRSALGAARTVFRPGFGMVDTLKSGYLMALHTEGANWMLAAPSFCSPNSGTTQEYLEAQWMIRYLIDPQTRVLRDMIKKGDDAIHNAGSPEAALRAAATLHTELAAFYQVAAKGDLQTIFLANCPQGGPEEAFAKRALKDSEFEIGLPTSKVPNGRSDQDQIIQGEHVRLTARFHEEEAARLSKGADALQTAGKQPGLKSLQQKLRAKLEGMFRRAFPHAYTIQIRYYANLAAGYHNNAKQYIIDVIQQIMADWVGFADVVILDADGHVQTMAVPLKVVKDLRSGADGGKDYHQVSALDSRPGQDDRFHYYERDEFDIVTTKLSPFKYLDNTAHYRKYKDDPTVYTTAETTAAPKLKMEEMVDPYLSKITGHEVKEKYEFYDLVYQEDGSRLRVFADGSQKTIRVIHDEATGKHTVEQIDGKAPAGEAPVLMVPGTERHVAFASELKQDRTVAPAETDQALIAQLENEIVPHPWGGKDDWNKSFNNTDMTPGWHFCYPTEYTSVSDNDQMDRAVTNLRLFHTRSNSYLRVMVRRPRPEEFPYDQQMADSEHDTLLETGLGTAWMMLKARTKTGRELQFPLNLNKDVDTTFWPMANELWRYIDENGSVKLMRKGDRYFLRLPYDGRALKNPAFVAALSDHDRQVIAAANKVTLSAGLPPGDKYQKRQSIVDVPLPLEMEPLTRQLAAISIDGKAVEFKKELEADSAISLDPVRYGETGGPVPVMDYVFIRRNAQGEVTNGKEGKDGLTMLDRVAQMLINGVNAPLNAEEKEDILLKGDEDIPEDDPKAKPMFRDYPWADRDGLVHLTMSEAEHQSLKPWLALSPYRGARKADYNHVTGELTMEVAHFTGFCETTYSQISYQRFMPDYTYRQYMDPTETEIKPEDQRS